MSYIGNQPTNIAFVTDTFSGNGSTVAFTMSVAPASTTSVLVAITGVLQDPSTYSVSGTTLTFSAAPPSGTGNISVRYLGIPASGITTTAYRTVTEFTATAGQTTFTPPSYTVGYIDVYRNGARLGSADFTATNGTTVVLAAACNAGDLVETVSMYVSSVLNAIPATAGAVNSTYITDAAVTQAKLAANVAGNGPAFSVYLNSSQSFSASTNTKVAYNTKEYDTATCFDTVNSRFTPNVAGYYMINAKAYISSSAQDETNISINLFKNGAVYKGGNSRYAPSYPQQHFSPTVSTIVYLNGSTDYIDVYVYSTGTSLAVVGYSGDTATTWFNGVLVRAA